MVARHIRDHRGRELKIRLRGAHGRDPVLDERDAERFVQGLHADAQSTGEPRAHALFELFEIGGRPVGRHNHLPPVVDQSVERMTELLLDGFALQELHVIDDEDVNGT